MRRWRILSLICCAALSLAPLQAAAQFQTDGQPILIVEREKLLTDSLPGKMVLEQDAEARAALEAEGRALDEEFRAEELRLTRLRPTIPAEEFRALAEAFDAKVVATRQEQIERAEEETRALQQRHNEFFAQLGPLLFQVMIDKRASAIIDADRVLVANQSLNITQEVIKRLDDAYLATQAEEENAPQDAPDEEAPQQE